MGRPPREPQISDERITLRATPAEREAWKQAAGDKSLSEWLRELGNKAAAEAVAEPREQCSDCGAEILGYHACQGVPGGFGDDEA